MPTCLPCPKMSENNSALKRELGLLQSTAINMIDKHNKRAIDYAIENNRQDIVDLIDSYNFDKSEVESDLDSITRKLI